MTEQDNKPLNDEWDTSNSVKVDSIYSKKEILALNPYRDDESYIAEKQVDLIRDGFKELNMSYVLATLVSRFVLTFLGMLILLDWITGQRENILLAVLGVASILLAYGSRWFLKDARMMFDLTAKYSPAVRIAALGEAYRSQYGLILGEDEKRRMMREGKIIALNATGEKFHVVASTSAEDSTYVTIYREDEGEKKD